MAHFPRVQKFHPRFVTEAQLTELFNLFHLARTALAGEKDQGPHARMCWASARFAEENPGITSTAAYKDLSGARDFDGRF